ncbi:Trehalose-6-P synthase/phosphatase complex subunit [Didymosphaeria variabile]|uniref:Trehalose-6-P synthase/phosphatase complex subunit n=1 Tax=Didymosphaeria variabile TaxID=1932322 RepID=A0A9W8XA02_9PLEO|nr:Trehalose-6-P synthase/phosphatase complex subunit [Didymosphaeria variabile]KAJ4344735.1 Trehalose-6-P synthase/phosphatase complex subunit [Didymosphaeria variabile]
MSNFHAALFLPYTADFEKPQQSQAASPVPTIPVSDLTRKNSIGSHEDAQKGSLLRDNAPAGITLPKTPAAMLAQEDYFTPTQPSATAHFLRPNDTKTLVRSDAHVPEWGAGGMFFNQPRSRALRPADNVLEYQKNEERKQHQREQSRERARSLYQTNSGNKKSDPRWEQNYRIVPAIQGNGGLTNAVRAADNAGSTQDVIHVGLIGFPTDDIDESKKKEIYEKLEEEHDALAVYVNNKDYDGHYAHYCKTILWPVFHYVIPDHPKSKAFLDHSWKFYENVNQAFADKIVKNYKRGDTIWVHDYHLCLVPAMVREKLPDAKIGFFLHTAFPSSEVFRCLAARTQLLEGMLGANLVAFQTPEYAYHFLQTCSRILAVEAVDDGVQLENRFVNVFASPIGIDPQKLAQGRDEKEVQDWIKTLTERYQGKHVIVARDKLDSIRGVRQKLLSFEVFLKKNPEWRDKVVLIQVATSTREDPELATTVSEIVTRIDAQYSTLSHNPLVFLRQDISFHQYLALCSIADAMVITSLREGMNLSAHEFIICQDGAYSNKKHSPLILSEFTGSSSIFDGAELAVNPWHYQGIADAFKVALEMSEDEKATRYHKLRSNVLHHTGEYWVRNLTEKLNAVFEEQFRRDTMSIPRLSASNLIKDYELTSNRLFILDYEGTLANYGSVNNTVITNVDKVIDILSDILNDKRNTVYVMSGRTVEELELAFNRLPNLGLIAENGCFVREGGSDEWVQFPDEDKTQAWKKAIKDILQYYVERVEGSWVEERQCSLIFHYESATDTASRQAGECANQINDASASQRVRAIPTKDSVIIEPADYDKATAAQHILDKYPPSDRPDFLFIAGNDRDDEIVFKWASELRENSTVRCVNTVTVGERNSLASSTLPTGTTGLLGVLTKLSKVKTDHS